MAVTGSIEFQNSNLFKFGTCDRQPDHGVVCSGKAESRSQIVWENSKLTSQWRDASANHHAPRRNENWAKESCAPEVTLFLRPQPSNFLAIMEDLRLFCAEFVISERFFAAQD